jgi:chromosome segregation ATPase
LLEESHPQLTGRLSELNKTRDLFTYQLNAFAEFMAAEQAVLEKKLEEACTEKEAALEEAEKKLDEAERIEEDAKSQIEFLKSSNEEEVSNLKNTLEQKNEQLEHALNDSKTNSELVKTTKMTLDSVLLQNKDYKDEIKSLTENLTEIKTNFETQDQKNLEQIQELKTQISDLQTEKEKELMAQERKLKADFDIKLQKMRDDFDSKLLDLLKNQNKSAEKSEEKEKKTPVKTLNSKR